MHTAQNTPTFFKKKLTAGQQTTESFDVHEKPKGMNHL